MVVTLLATTTAVSILFLLRRLQGEISSLTTPAWLLVTLLVAGSLFLIRRTWYSTTWLDSTTNQTAATDTPAWALYRAMVWWSPTISQLLLGCALTQANSPRLGLVVWWSAILAGELWWWNYLGLRRQKHAPPHFAPAANQTASAGTAPSPRLIRDQDDSSISETDDDEADEGSSGHETLLLPPDVDQQLAYYRSSTGAAWVEGIYRVRFIGAQKLAEIHLAFCPPLPSRPGIEVQWLQGGASAQSVQWQVVQAEPYGGRVEVRRRDNSETGREVVLMIVAKPK